MDVSKELESEEKAAGDRRYFPSGGFLIWTKQHGHPRDLIDSAAPRHAHDAFSSALGQSRRSSTLAQPAADLCVVVDVSEPQPLQRSRSFIVCFVRG